MNTRYDYDWARFDADIKERALALECTQVIHDFGLAPPRARARFSIVCPCPGHDDSDPSCSVRSESWKCFGCGEGGDVLDLLGVLSDLPDFESRLRRALELQGIDYDQEREAFLEASRASRPVSPSSQARQKTSPAASPPLRSSREKVAPARHPEDADILMSVLSRLELDARALEYLEGRGVSGALARAYGIVSATYEQWAGAVERASGYFGEEALEQAGLLGSSRRAHPFVERMLVFPYIGPAGPVGLRLRRLSHDTTYSGARYLGRRHGHNRVPTPYLSGPDGWPQGITPRRGLLWVVEGEFDALSLRSLGRACLGVPGAQAFSPRWVESWARAGGVVLLLDADREGVAASRDMADAVRHACEQVHGEAWAREHVHVREVSGAKDANELLARGDLLALVRGIEADLG